MALPLIPLAAGAALIGGLLYLMKGKAKTASGTAPTGADPALAYAKGLADGKATGEFNFKNGFEKGSAHPDAAKAAASGNASEYNRGFNDGYDKGYDAAKLAGGKTTDIVDVIGKHVAVDASDAGDASEGTSKNPDANAAFALAAYDAGKISGEIDGTRDGHDNDLDTAPSPNPQPDPENTSFFKTNFVRGYEEVYPFYYAQAQDLRRTAMKKEVSGATAAETAGRAAGNSDGNIDGRNDPLPEEGGPGPHPNCSPPPSSSYKLNYCNAYTDAYNTAYHMAQAAKVAGYASDRTGAHMHTGQGHVTVDMGRVKSDIDSGKLPAENARRLALALAHHGHDRDAATVLELCGPMDAPHTGALGGAAMRTEVASRPLSPSMRASSASDATRPLSKGECYEWGFRQGRAARASGAAATAPTGVIGTNDPDCLKAMHDGYSKGYGTETPLPLTKAKPESATYSFRTIRLADRSEDWSNGFRWAEADCKNKFKRDYSGYTGDFRAGYLAGISKCMTALSTPRGVATSGHDRTGNLPPWFRRSA